MAETFRYHDSKWSEARDAEFEAARRRHDLYGWPAKHPRCCPECGRPYTAHDELGRCPADEENPSHKEAYGQGWNAGHHKLNRDNPYPSNTDEWAHYEEGYQEGAAELARCVSGKTEPWVQAIIEKLNKQEAERRKAKC